MLRNCKKKQLKQVKKIFKDKDIKEKERKNIIFVGHHPVYSCVQKKDKKEVWLEAYKNFFERS